MTDHPKPDANRIVDAFHAAWDEFGDEKSTEFLIAITADRCDVGYMDVATALAPGQEKRT